MLILVPEVDASRYSRIAALAKGASRTTDGFTPSETNILAQLDKEITGLQDTIGESEQLVIIMSTPIRTVLNNVKNIERHLDVTQFKAGAIDTKVKTYNEIPILSVPSLRMKSAYVFSDDRTGGGRFQGRHGGKGDQLDHHLASSADRNLQDR